MNKNIKVLESFVSYCEHHPEERFWQALRNWCGWSFIFVSRSIEPKDAYPEILEDTFYWESQSDK